MTARHRTHHPAVAAWLVRHGIDAVVDDDPDRAYWLGRQVLVTNKKLGAALYVDDRALAFTGDWDAALPEALRRIGEPPDPPAQPAADLPALTIRQPWLAAILAGDKQVENRSWPTRHRGPVVLHAARALARDGQTDPHVRAVLARPGAPTLTTGALAATANITDCHRDTGCCRPGACPACGTGPSPTSKPSPTPSPPPAASASGASTPASTRCSTAARPPLCPPPPTADPHPPQPQRRSPSDPTTERPRYPDRSPDGGAAFLSGSSRPQGSFTAVKLPRCASLAGTPLII
ncbi:hypothetical protein ACFQ0M_49195 [Kitasatospora aburaviensis]